jgi:hypothetical protein
MSYGGGRITLLGFDPTTPWLAESKTIGGLWRGLLPPRSGADAGTLTDDSQILSAVNQLPALALPPIGGLLILLAAYILVIGPLNYLVLRRLDRREWAWFTMPAFVLAFAAAAYGYGSILRGTDVVINEIAIVRGAPDATEGTAQDYFGVFSPTRGTYLIQIPGGALLASPISSDPFSGVPGGILDIVQGNPAEVRNLSVGVAQLRTIRAETATTVPRVKVSLTLGNGTLTGTLENASDEPLEQVAVVLGGSVVSLGSVGPHATAPVRLTIQPNQFGIPIADRIVGSLGGSATEDDVRRAIRYTMVNQLTFDPNMGFASSLQSEKPVVLAFGRRSPLDIRIGGQAARRSTNVMYYIPVDVTIRGKVTFEGDLIRETIVAGDAMQFVKQPGMLNLGLGTVTVAYRPIGFEGTLAVSGVQLGLSQGGGLRLGQGKPIEPLPAVPPECTDVDGTEPAGCETAREDFLPDIEVFDRTGAGAWVRLPRIGPEAPYSLTNPSRYVDPTTGQILVRFVNDNPEAQFGFSFQVSISGEIR